jgi:hypothetical protein
MRQAGKFVTGAVTVLLSLAATARADSIDPTGDTFGAGAGQHDITSYVAQILGSDVRWIVRFAGPISPASAFAPDSVIGFIDIDTDRNPATGGTAPWGTPLAGGNSWINFFVDPNPGLPSIPGPLTALGDELYVDLFSEAFHPGLVDVVDSATNNVQATVPITFGAMSFSFSLPTSVLGNSLVNYGVLVGTFSELTDRTPNGDAPATSEARAVPEPASLSLLGAGALSLLGWAWRRRRATAA